MNIFIKTKLISSALFFMFISQTSYSAEPAGKTMVARGQVKATSAIDNSIRKLKRRSQVFSTDTVITGASSKTQLRMTDGGMIALKENTELVIEQYQLNANGEKGSVVLDLVQGGLRSITGAIKADKGDYQLKTSIASIGIRGTHYEVEIIDGVLWLAVWDGAIDIVIDSSGNTLSLGTGESFSYASVDKNGNISPFIEPPTTFKKGLSTPLKFQGSIANKNDKKIVNDGLPHQNPQIDVGDLFADIQHKRQRVIVHDSLDENGSDSLVNLVSFREGSVTYGDAIVTSDYNLTNFQAGLDINFDTGEVSNGQLSFDDDQDNGQWNAVFNGNVNITDDNVFLEVDVTYATHGDRVVDGNISTGFVESLGLESVAGDFELFEVDSNTRVDGSYQIKSN